ncbi:MAG: ATP-dependent sacrificial sulfur transferase LarE [Roseburia sp.]|nr:ATP-dependent sacrificial sulfur transferase LarE [Roseburia sp.]
MERLQEKYEQLKQYLNSLGSVAVAFSGGVDSTFLLWAAYEALGGRMMAVTADSLSFPVRELNEARDFCSSNGIRQQVFCFEELAIEGFRDNPPDRCYLCKRELFKEICRIAGENGMSQVAEGSNLDDNRDYRPGMAAVAQLGVKSPLREIGFTKSEIRMLSRELKLPTWDKQSFACLATRFAYGERISEEKLHMVDRAEALLLELGFHQVRVRIHGALARIEVLPDELFRLVQEETRRRIYEYFRELGFTYVSLDLGGYRQGSMNELLNLQKADPVSADNGAAIRNETEKKDYDR